MTTEQDLKEIHDKATRGLGLAPDEQASLEAWYAKLDQEEASALSTALRPQSLTVLHGEVEAATARLVAATQRLEKTAAENDRLRRESRLCRSR